MNTLQKWLVRAVVASALLLIAHGNASAQTKFNVVIWEPTGVKCTARVTLLIYDSANTLLGTYTPTNSTYNITLTAVPPADKSLQLRFQRVSGVTNLTVDGINGVYNGTHTIDFVIPK